MKSLAIGGTGGSDSAGGIDLTDSGEMETLIVLAAGYGDGLEDVRFRRGRSSEGRGP